MAVSATVSNHFKYALAKKMLDLENDTIRAILLRNGFVFNKDYHARLTNLKGYLSALQRLYLLRRIQETGL